MTEAGDFIETEFTRCAAVLDHQVLHIFTGYQIVRLCLQDFAIF